MKNIIKFIVIMSALINYGGAIAQPSYVYQGGPEYGEYSDETNVNNNTLYKGSDEQGMYSDETNVNNNTLYKGSDEQGVYSDENETNNNILYKGNKEVGIYSSILNTNNTFLFKGGGDDGYSSFYDKKDFIWTGAIGQSWTVPGNWNYNTVPDINRRTIIPTGVPAYPHVNAGLFAIGKNPNNGAYKSGELIILPGALLVTRVNCRVENYGLISIGGHMNIKKNTSDAFKNLSGGLIIVESNGLFSF